MRIICSPTFWDYEQAFRLHRSRTLATRIRYFLLYRIVPVLAAIGLILLNAFDVKAQRQTAGMALGFLIALLWIGVLLLLVPSEEVRRNFKRKAKSDNIVFEIDDDKVLIEDLGFSESRMFWRSFISFVKNDKVALLYYSKECFLLIPTEALSSIEKFELCAIVDRNLKRNIV